MLHLRDTTAPSPADAGVRGAAPPAGSWHAAAVASYRRSAPAEQAALADALAARVLALTGHCVARDAIYVATEDQVAAAMVDSCWFQLRRGALCLVRACVSCGFGRFASPPIDDLSDLGYAVAIWEPRCADCTVDDEDWSHSW